MMLRLSTRRDNTRKTRQVRSAKTRYNSFSRQKAIVVKYGHDERTPQMPARFCRPAARWPERRTHQPGSGKPSAVGLDGSMITRVLNHLHGKPLSRKIRTSANGSPDANKDSLTHVGFPPIPSPYQAIPSKSSAETTLLK